MALVCSVPSWINSLLHIHWRRPCRLCSNLRILSKILTGDTPNNGKYFLTIRGSLSNWVLSHNSYYSQCHISGNNTSWENMSCSDQYDHTLQKYDWIPYRMVSAACLVDPLACFLFCSSWRSQTQISLPIFNFLVLHFSWPPRRVWKNQPQSWTYHKDMWVSSPALTFAVAGFETRSLQCPDQKWNHYSWCKLLLFLIIRRLNQFIFDLLPLMMSYYH